jgi:hypothetical protein
MCLVPVRMNSGHWQGQEIHMDPSFMRHLYEVYQYYLLNSTKICNFTTGVG